MGSFNGIEKPELEDSGFHKFGLVRINDCGEVDYIKLFTTPTSSRLGILRLEVERAWARVRRPGPNIPLAVNKPRLYKPNYLKKLGSGVSSYLRFSISKYARFESRHEDNLGRLRLDFIGL